MRPLHFVMFAVSLLYTVGLMLIEWKTSQAFVRQFLGDIQQGQIPFYGINTTLTTFMLWASALLFAISLLCIDRGRERREFWFCWSQLLIFFGLGFDERFMVHERIGNWTGIQDAYLLFAVGCVELLFLARLGALPQRSRTTLAYLGLGGFAFLVMVAIDAFLPSALMLRLSAEDLSKFWGCLFLFLFAWEVLRQHINRLKGNRLKTAALS